MTYQVRENVAGRWHIVGSFVDFIEAQAAAIWCANRAQVRMADGNAWRVVQWSL